MSSLKNLTKTTFPTPGKVPKDRRGKGKRPSHALSVVPAGSDEHGPLYRVNSIYTFVIGLPKYWALASKNKLIVNEDLREIMQGYLDNFKVCLGRQVRCRIKEFSLITSIIEVEVTIFNDCYQRTNLKTVSRSLMERYRDLRDDVVRPKWLEFIETHQVKYRIKRRYEVRGE